MRLSISSSNDRLPRGNWITTWIIIWIVFISCIAFIEYHLRNKGFRPTLVDSVELWSAQRAYASSLGKNAIILIGASRMQDDIDVDSLAEITGLQPVQLAIDGNPFMPVFKNLADDASITGTIIVSITASNIWKGKPEHKSAEWVNSYNLSKQNKIEPYKKINNSIKAYFDNNLVSRLAGAKPAKVISSLLFSQNSLGNYLTMDKNRSRSLDFNKVQMPDFYAIRVLRAIGKKEFVHSPTFEVLFAKCKKYISAVQACGTQKFHSDLNYLLSLTKKIEDRGGNVIFIKFPTDKLVWKFDQARFPKDIFWAEIEKRHSKSIHFKDYPETSKFHLKDGSHLDFRDKKDFTNGLMNIILKKQFIPNPDKPEKLKVS